MADLPEEFVVEVREALAHLYDYAYLLRHPLLGRLQALLGDESTLAVQKLRQIILEAMDRMRPSPDVPQSDVAWRPYLVLHRRYILGKELDEMEAELSLGRRQIQREERRTLEALTVMLWEQNGAVASRPQLAGADEGLQQEIARAANQRQDFEAGEQLQKALQSVQSLAQQRGVTLAEMRSTGPQSVVGQPLLFRQLLVGALSFAVRLAAVKQLALGLQCQGNLVIASLEATPAPLVEAVAEVVELPEALAALATTVGARIAQQRKGDTWCLQFSVPASPGKRTIALVEDNQDAVTLFSRYLARHGYRLLVLDDSATILARLEENPPDALILDVMMPEMDGWEILGRMKAEHQLRQVPVIICSVLDEAELAFSLGAAAYLRKPVSPVQLLECLASLGC